MQHAGQFPSVFRGSGGFGTGGLSFSSQLQFPVIHQSRKEAEMPQFTLAKLIWEQQSLPGGGYYVLRSSLQPQNPG